MPALTQVAVVIEESKKIISGVGYESTTYTVEMRQDEARRGA